MDSIINGAFSRTRVVVMALMLVLGIGAYAYSTIPKEANPEIPLPLFYVSTSLDGISPTDAERLLLEPMETEFSSISGLDSMNSDAAEGFASIQLEFAPGGDDQEALDKVREAADRAQGDLPDDARDITITEINTALFPILNVILSGPVPERTLNALAEDLQDEIEGIEGVLEAEIGGQRFEFLEVLIDPTVFQTYNLSFGELIGQIQRNNRLIAAGAIETGSGRIVLKVPGLIEDLDDVMSMPVKVRGDAVVTFGDVATIRRTFEDPSSFARINGQPALALEITKRSGANIIETVDAVRAVVEDLRVEWPESIKITYLQDQSKQVKDMLSDLEANVIAAIILVMIVIVLALGTRSAILVGLSIPGAFLAGVIALWLMGYTMNIVVLFSLILVVGMLVDGAIVITELADRKLQEGLPPKEAYAFAAKRMAWPIIASTATTLMMSAGQGDEEETIGTLQLELTPWNTRRTAADLGVDIRKSVADIAGIDVQVQTESGGPADGKPVNLKVKARNPEVQAQSVQVIRDIMDEIGGFTDVTDTRPVPGVEVSILVNRAEAARFGADVSLLGQAVQLLTQGITVADYRPDDIDGSLDIRVRFPREERSLSELAGLRVPTSSGLVPISNFVTFAPSERTGVIRRIDSKRVTTIEANVAPDVLVNDQITLLTQALNEAELPDGVEFSFGGEAEDQAESMIFLVSAFGAAIFMMFVILVIQFNNFYQAFIVMSAIVFSIAGVLLGLLVTGRAFGIVMGGIGVIALAGIVVNNNIVLIDTYNALKRSGQSPLEAALRTGAQRLRPVMLTSLTTALGLMPMVIGVNLNFFSREIVYGAPSTQMWTELSSAIAGGLVVATVLTLVVTPAMLMLGERRANRNVAGLVPA